MRGKYIGAHCLCSGVSAGTVSPDVWLQLVFGSRGTETERDSWIQNTPASLSLPRVKPRSWKCLRPPLSSVKKHNTEGYCRRGKLFDCGLPKEATKSQDTLLEVKNVWKEGREGNEVKGYMALSTWGWRLITCVQQTSATWMSTGRVWFYKHWLVIHSEDRRRGFIP